LVLKGCLDIKSIGRLRSNEKACIIMYTGLKYVFPKMKTCYKKQ